MGSGGKYLLLFTVFLLVDRCEQKPQVIMWPTLKQVFSGDLVYLTCQDTGPGGVTWYFNDDIQAQITNVTWQIALASPRHSGSYQCEKNRQKSEHHHISVLNFVPSASLIRKTGQPVVKPGDSVILQLEYEDDLGRWNCWVQRGMKRNRIKLILKDNNSLSISFQTTKLLVSESIFWCTDENQERRSNQVIVRTSDEGLALEMYPLPALVGMQLSLRCLVWGIDDIKNVIFYKEDQIIKPSSSSPTFSISEVTEAEQGRYKCLANYRFKDTTFEKVSDLQDVFVQSSSPIKATVSGRGDLMCSCPSTSSSPTGYNWYHKENGESWKFVGTTKHYTPVSAGTYACRAVWSNMKSLLSDEHHHLPSANIILVVVLILLVLIGATVAALVWWKWRNRNNTGPIYEDVLLRPQAPNDYESLQGGLKREREYDTLQPEAQDKGMKGDYQALKRDGKTEGVYHTLGEQRAAGGEGGYEALKKEGMKEGVYHSLGQQETAEGEAGYQALKKEGLKEGVYHTVGSTETETPGTEGTT